MDNSPTLWVFAGINGAGKSTIQQRIFENDEVKVINADVLTAQKPLLSSGVANTFGGGREAIQQVREALINHQSFSIESTLGGKGDRDTYAMKVMQEARKQGYQVNLVYVALDSADIAKERVSERVAKGGHDIPPDMIERRYPETLRRLDRVIELADNAYVYDNSGRNYQLVAQKENNQVFRFSTPDWLAKYLPKPGRKQSQAPQPQNEGGPETTQEAQQTEINGFAFDNGIMAKERLDLEALAQAITTHYDGEKTNYYFNNELAFFDYGQSIRMASEQASKRDDMVLIALQTAILHHKSGFKIVGSDEFKQKALSLIAEYDLKVTLTDKNQQAELEKLRQEYQNKKISLVDSHTSQTKNKTDGNKFGQGKPDENNNHNLSLDTDAIIAGNNNKKENEPDDTAVDQQGCIRGELVKVDNAPYLFKEGEKFSPYIVLKTDNERNPTRTLWGVDFPRAMAEFHAKEGDLVKVRHLGRKPVTVSVPIKDEKNKIVGYEKIETIRNAWEVIPEYPKSTNNNPEAIPARDFKGYDVKTFKEIQEKVHEQLYSFYAKNNTVPNLSNDVEKYKGDYVWFYPNGKPVPDDVKKPMTPPNLSDFCRLSGQMVFIEQGTSGASPINAVLVVGRDGYLQGVIRDRQTDVFHDVIVPINQTKQRGNINKTYATFVEFKNEQCNYMAYGNIDKSGEVLKYKLSDSKEIRGMMLTNEDLKYQNGYGELFKNDRDQNNQKNTQQQEAQYVNKQTRSAKQKM
ncbi:LPD7 domain-containing protein [Photorhabdus asymbiotica]|uniref:LPD7 domain-containing protein n=2 Tax=Photorhabdus asymbiotica TaxID=291112 RepID=UPI003DA71755